MSIVHKSRYPDVEIPSVPITEFVLRRAGELADRRAIEDVGSGRGYTYGELKGAIHALAGGLQAKGIGPGSTVAIMAPNLPEYALVFHGVAVAGATNTTLNPTYTADEIRHQLQDSGAELLVTIGMFLDTARDAIEGTSVSEIVTMDAAEGTTPLTALFGEPIEQVPVDTAEHVVVLPYSSGTTGLPKGVMLTHRNLVANIAQCDPVLDVSGDDEVAIAALPFFHIYGMQVLMNGLLANGVEILSMPRFDLQQALEAIQDQKVTRFFAVPPMVLALAKHPLVDEYDLSSLRQVFSGAAPLGAELAEEAAARIGTEVVQGYGMSELSPVSHATPPGEYRPGTSGVAVPNTECRIVDADGEDQDVGGRGELWVRGPQVMKGYLNNDEATRHTIDEDGWLHTGDVAELDEAGHYSIVDRVKELIKYNGFQVPPAELEALIVTHPKVMDVAVIGVPDVSAGELPKAFVVVKPGMEMTEDEVKEHVAAHVASYKHIRIVEFTDAIPKSASGKILRRMLRDQS
ncbi:MAG TPA: AMP-binding protein [Acidimicrobiales bacterium]|nr:AMP-binding protein [Acidimicrobiales bacterium]